ncbi:MAG: hypothetical protein ACK4WC_00080 [Rubrimonas sp.]
MTFSRLMALFDAPDAYDDDARGFLLNQIGHIIVGALLAWLLGTWIALALYAAWEIAQLWFRAAQPHDCAEDLAFVAAGAMAVAVSPLVLVPAAAHLAAGALRRAGF